MFWHKSQPLLILLLGCTALAEVPTYTISTIGSDSRDNTGHARTRAVAINNSGQVLGEYVDYTSSGSWLGSHSVLWENGSLTHLPILSSSSQGLHHASPSPYGQALLDSDQAMLMA